jgi:hypothetical protein
MDTDTDPLEDSSKHLIRISMRNGELYVDEPAHFSKEYKAEIIKTMVKSNNSTLRVPRTMLQRIIPTEPIARYETTSETIDLTSEPTDSGRKKRKTSPLRGDLVTFDSEVVARARALQQKLPNDNIAETIGDLVAELIRVSSLIGQTAAKPDTAAVENSPKEKADAETETPIWWDFGAPAPQTQQTGPIKTNKKKTPKSTTGDNSASQGAQTMEVDATEVSEPRSGAAAGQSSWSTVVRRKAKKSAATEPTEKTRETKPTVATGLARPRAPRSAAVIVKVAKGSSYDDTVRQVRQSGVDPEALGAKISAMRRTRNGDLLVDLGKSKASRAALEPLRKALVEKIGSQVGPVSKLGAYLEVEVVDIDSVADREEVLRAVRKALSETNKDDDTALASISEITVTGLWGLRSGQQVATLRVPRTIPKGITHVKIGWTVCRVRPKRPDPTRCYRCHSFGHTTANCQGPDMSGCCRKCGASGHKEKECSVEKCVACERAGHKVTPHRPGSGACAARRAAEAWRTASQRND